MGRTQKDRGALERVGSGRRQTMDTWQAKWKPPRPVHRNPCLVLGCSDESSIREAFEKFGKIDNVFIPEGQSFAFVRYEDKYDAENAMNALNGTQIGGKQVKVIDGKTANKEVSAWHERNMQKAKATVMAK